jgi:hypothetical protein
MGTSRKRKRLYSMRISCVKLRSGTVATCGLVSDKGDSGLFIVNQSGEVVGMHIEVVKSMKLVALSGEAEIFSPGYFVNIEDALRWATKMLGEEVEIVCDSVALD